VLVALQLHAPPATNLAGCTEVNGKGISHKCVPDTGTGLLLDLVAVLITDVHMRNGPQVRRQNLLPVARNFLLVTARVHPPRPPLPFKWPVSSPAAPSIASLRSNTGKTSQSCRSFGCAIEIWWC
jgi:hypothetical protein